jgi:hypothetical protein
MTECNNSTCKIHYKQQLLIAHKSSNNVWHLISKTITALQHSSTLHRTSPNYTSLHFTTLNPTTLHYTYWHFTSSHLHFTALLFSFTHLHFISFSIYTNLKDGGRANMDAVLRNVFANVFNGMFWCGELIPELRRSILDAPCITKYSNSSCWNSRLKGFWLRFHESWRKLDIYGASGK